MKKVIRDPQIETKGILYNKNTHILAYADDVVAVGRSLDALKETMKELMKIARVMGLTVKMEYTKYM